MEWAARTADMVVKGNVAKNSKGGCPLNIPLAGQRNLGGGEYHYKKFIDHGGAIMSLLTRWDPMQDIQEFEKRLSSWMGRPPMKKEGDKESMRVMEWAPLVDISEDEKEYVIKADLPEIKKEDVKISVHDGVLSISGERKYEKKRKKGKSIIGWNVPMVISKGAFPFLPIQKKRRCRPSLRTAS